jgi:protein-tyrosine-phosphatase
MTGLHAMRLLTEFPAYDSKITCMPNDIPDPFGGDEAAYDACLSEIKKGIEKMRLTESDV